MDSLSSIFKAGSSPVSMKAPQVAFKGSDDEDVDMNAWMRSRGKKAASQQDDDSDEDMDTFDFKGALSSGCTLESVPGLPASSVSSSLPELFKANKMASAGSDLFVRKQKRPLLRKEPGLPSVPEDEESIFDPTKAGRTNTSQRVSTSMRKRGKNTPKKAKAPLTPQQRTIQSLRSTPTTSVSMGVADLVSSASSKKTSNGRAAASLRHVVQSKALPAAPQRTFVEATSQDIELRELSSGRRSAASLLQEVQQRPQRQAPPTLLQSLYSRLFSAPETSS